MSVPCYWACSLPPIFVCDGATFALCDGCRDAAAQGRITRLLDLSAPPGASVPATPTRVDAASPSQASRAVSGGAGAYNPQLARRIEAGRAERAR